MTAQFKTIKKGALLLGLLLLATPSAFALPEWPSSVKVSSKLRIYSDHEDPSLFYYIPKEFRIKKNRRTGAIMVNHELFVYPRSPDDSVTLYHITMEPVLRDATVEVAKMKLRHKHRDAQLIPMPLTKMKFSLTHKPTNATTQRTYPFDVALPNWTGDSHDFSQSFSASIIGDLWTEPAISRFMTDDSGNALLGTVHYGFLGISPLFKGYAKVNIKKVSQRFHAKLSATYKYVKQDIEAVLQKAKDNGEIVIYSEKRKNHTNEMWKVIQEKLIDMLFSPVPDANTGTIGRTRGRNASAKPKDPKKDPKKPAAKPKGKSPQATSGGGQGGTQPLFEFSIGYYHAIKEGEIIVNLEEREIAEHTGDLEFTAGNVPEESLAENIKYLCDAWAKFEADKDRCVNQCVPFYEMWDYREKTCIPSFGVSP